MSVKERVIHRILNARKNNLNAVWTFPNIAGVVALGIIQVLNVLGKRRATKMKPHLKIKWAVVRFIALNAIKNEKGVLMFGVITIM